MPRGSADRMIGAMAHPLNQAIIDPDPEKNIVVAGYGILQPRVGVSVQSASRSRLASLYSGETGFDIYTRAISDVYQDLYGEGIFAGKGIYEVDTVHRVLDRRFPRNALLSHDLIEGAYARAGLASDIEIIEDYPSHYSAYNRRKHRWLRGDWQITGWLLSRVPDESGRKVPNPISLVSQWKILDNLRRSLVEPATFLLLVFGWLVLPGQSAVLDAGDAWHSVCAGLVPVPVQPGAGCGRAEIAGGQGRSLRAAHGQCQHVFYAVLPAAPDAAFARCRGANPGPAAGDAAAAAGMGDRGGNRTEHPQADSGRYLSRLDARAGAGIGRPGVLHPPPRFFRRAADPAALGLQQMDFDVAEPAVAGACAAKLPTRTNCFSARTALRTWRYFAEFSTEEHNWLIPDNVQEEPAAVAAACRPPTWDFF